MPDSPRTDAKIRQMADDGLDMADREKELHDFARTLERENADLRRQLVDGTSKYAERQALRERAETAERQLKNEQGQSASYLANWKATEKGYNELDKRRIDVERQLAEARKALSWLEDNSTLHKRVEILYVVDGYELQVEDESGNVLAGAFHGETIEAAAIRALKENGNG